MKGVNNAFLLLTPVVMGILILVMVGLHVVANKLEEFEQVFHFMTWASVLLIIGAAVYLSYATPTFARLNLTSNGAPVTVDDSNLLQE